MIENTNSNQDVDLKGLIEDAGFTEPELSRRLGVGIRIIGDWKHRRKIPRFDNAIFLARELGVPLKVLAKSMGLDVSGIPDDSQRPRRESPENGD